MQPTTIRFTESNRERLDQLVEESDHFSDRSDAIRYAIREFLQVEGEA